MSTSVWQIDERDFPVSADISEKIKFWLRYAILAPSAHNTQPWLVEVKGESLFLYRDPEHTLAVGDPTLRETFIGLGAFIENLVVAAAHWGFDGKVEIMAQTVHAIKVASVKFIPVNARLPFEELFDGLTKRHTNRGNYSSDLSSTFLDEAERFSEPEIKLFSIVDSQARLRIAELVGEGTKLALSMKPMVRELFELIDPIDTPETGMSLGALVEKLPNSRSSYRKLGEIINPEAEALYWRGTFSSSPLHVIIGSEYDGPEAWLGSGRLMERVLLDGARHNFAHCIAAAPIEVPTLSPRLRAEIDSRYRPQVLFRLGRPLNPNFTKISGRRSPRIV